MQLEQEKRRLNNNLQTATAEANKKAGEVDNLRRRAEAANRANEQRISAQQHAQRENEEKLQAERDSLRLELERTKDSNKFTENEVQDERLRRTRRAIPTRPKPAAAVPASPVATPKKAQKTLPIGDGFDDEDIVMASPSKRREKAKAATPKQAGKRKRQVFNDSPIAALQLSEPRERPKPPEPVPAPQQDGKLDIALLRHLWKDDHRFILLHRLLAHRSSNGTDRVLEALTQHAFPSQPQKKLSSMVYDALSSSGASPNARELAFRICRAFLKLWRQCLQENYYAPVYLMLDALHFVLACEPAKTAAELAVEIIPLIMDSVQLVAEPVYWGATGDKKKLTELFSPAQRQIASEIDVLDCLELLYLIATSCLSLPSPEAEALPRFWRTISSPWVLLLLNKAQPLPHISLMLRVLSTSPLSTSFGPIVSDDPREQANAESQLVSRLTNLFTDTLTTIPDPQEPSTEPIPDDRIWQLRLSVLDVLTQFSIPEHGSTFLAQHNLCVGRLVKYLNSCVMSLYTHPLSPNQDRKIASINATMKLIHHIVISNPGFAVKNKLDGTLGGHHAYKVCLTRLAFSEGLVLEAGIEPAVMDMASDILDENLGPEEGEEYMQVFSSGTSV